MLTPIKQSELFLKNWNAILSGKYRYIINEGGARSSKTFSLIQCYLNLAGMDALRLTVWREKRTWTKSSVYNDFIRYIKDIGIYSKANSNETELIYRFGKSTIEFNGMDDYQKLHGLTQDYAWLNEAMEAGKEDFEQIDMRTRKMIFMDYNPTEEVHFIYDLKKLPETYVIKSTVLDNPFIEKSIRKKILDYEPNDLNIARGTADPYKWSVYGLGMPAKREGLIYSYEMIGEWPRETNFLGYGLDFGFYPDPAACARIGMYDGRLVIDEIMYENNLTYVDVGSETGSIETRLREAGVRNELIIADSAAKTGIRELRIAKFNIVPCRKYAGSVKDGIDLMQNYQPLQITDRSLNTKKELDNYTWKKDVRNDVFLKDPIDDYNHVLDLARYVVQRTHGRKSTGMRQVN